MAVDERVQRDADRAWIYDISGGEVGGSLLAAQFSLATTTMTLLPRNPQPDAVNQLSHRTGLKRRMELAGDTLCSGA